MSDIVVESIHEFPRIRVAPHLQPPGDVEITGSGRCRIRHDDLALVDRLGEILPRFRLGKIELSGLDGIEADRCAIHIHADPLRRVLRIPVLRLDLIESLRRVALQHSFVGKNRKA